MSYEIQVSTPKPDNRGATGHGASADLEYILQVFEQEWAAGERMITITCHRPGEPSQVILDTKHDIDHLCLLGLPVCAPPGLRSRPSALAERVGHLASR